jgi:hypothetical protein
MRGVSPGEEHLTHEGSPSVRETTDMRKAPLPTGPLLPLSPSLAPLLAKPLPVLLTGPLPLLLTGPLPVLRTRSLPRSSAGPLLAEAGSTGRGKDPEPTGTATRGGTGMNPRAAGPGKGPRLAGPGEGSQAGGPGQCLAPAEPEQDRRAHGSRGGTRADGTEQGAQSGEPGAGTRADAAGTGPEIKDPRQRGSRQSPRPRVLAGGWEQKKSRAAGAEGSGGGSRVSAGSDVSGCRVSAGLGCQRVPDGARSQVTPGPRWRHVPNDGTSRTTTRPRRRHIPDGGGCQVSKAATTRFGARRRQASVISSPSSSASTSGSRTRTEAWPS